MPKPEAKWKQQYRAKVAEMSNETLLEEVLQLANGDDYDPGYFSKMADFQYHEVLYPELESRLKACGFLPLFPAYDPNFGDEKLCECGHEYRRHFDPYEDNAPVGCKYCRPSDKYVNTEGIEHPANYMQMDDEERDRYTPQCAGFKLAKKPKAKK